MYAIRAKFNIFIPLKHRNTRSEKTLFYCEICDKSGKREAQTNRKFLVFIQFINLVYLCNFVAAKS